MQLFREDVSGFGGMNRCAIVGIGNTLAGDDGAGIVAVKRLQHRCVGRGSPSFLTLQGDLFEIADHLPRHDRFVFVDALVASTAGEIREPRHIPPSLAPSNHQSDIVTVMRMLRTVQSAGDFPDWELWGITVTPPFHMGEGLSPAVERGVVRLSAKLQTAIERGTL